MACVLQPVIGSVTFFGRRTDFYGLEDAKKTAFITMGMIFHSCVNCLHFKIRFFFSILYRLFLLMSYLPYYIDFFKLFDCLLYLEKNNIGNRYQSIYMCM